MLIPKVFHRIWIGSKPMPDDYKRFGDTWVKHHPDWEHRLWTEADLPPLRNQRAYDNAPCLGCKCDIARYEILLQFGGVYIDADFECLRNLEPLIEHLNCFVACERDEVTDIGTYSIYNNAIIGCVPQHRFLQHLVTRLEPWIRMTQTMPHQVPGWVLTGPMFMTSVIYAHPDVTRFPARYFYPYGPMERWRRRESFPEAYAVHHYSHSEFSNPHRVAKQYNEGDVPNLSVVVQPVGNTNAIKLRWVMEGLAAQSNADIEILVPSDPERNVIYDDFSERLFIRRIAYNHLTNTPAEYRNAALHAARAERTFFLDEDCVPEQMVTAYHSTWDKYPIVMFSYRYLYPEERMFSFRDTIHYASLFMAASPELRNLDLSVDGPQCQHASSFAFSVPTKLAINVGGFDTGFEPSDITGFLKRLAARECPSVPAFSCARVIQMGARDI